VFRISCILLYQCLGLHQRPHSVHLSNQYLSFLASGSPMGGFTIVISSGGRILGQNAFLQSPCFRVQRHLTTMLTMRRRVSGWRTGAYFSDFVPTRSL
jgi:hypothetical protein